MSTGPPEGEAVVEVGDGNFQNERRPIRRGDHTAVVSGGYVFLSGPGVSDECMREPSPHYNDPMDLSLTLP